MMNLIVFRLVGFTKDGSRSITKDYETEDGLIIGSEITFRTDMTQDDLEEVLIDLNKDMNSGYVPIVINLLAHYTDKKNTQKVFNDFVCCIKQSEDYKQYNTLPVSIKEIFEIICL